MPPIFHHYAHRAQHWPVALRFHELLNPEFGEILAAVRSERAGTLVLGMDERLISSKSVELLRNRLSCPAVLVK